MKCERPSKKQENTAGLQNQLTAPSSNFFHRRNVLDSAEYSTINCARTQRSRAPSPESLNSNDELEDEHELFDTLFLDSLKVNYGKEDLLGADTEVDEASEWEEQKDEEFGESLASMAANSDRNE
jgi:hypothetical protein